MVVQSAASDTPEGGLFGAVDVDSGFHRLYGEAR